MPTDDRLAAVSRETFHFDGIPARLALAFVSPHVNFDAAARRLKGIAGATILIAISTTGELCNVFVARQSHALGDMASHVDLLHHLDKKKAG